MADTFDPYYHWLGIPPEEQPPDHYRLLGLREFESNPDAIQNAADQRMAHLRNFQGGRHVDLSQRLLNQVALARVCLLDPQKKAAYDRQLQAQRLARQPAPSPAASEEVDETVKQLVAEANLGHGLRPHHAHPRQAFPLKVALALGGAGAGGLLLLGLVLWLFVPGPKPIERPGVLVFHWELFERFNAELRIDDQPVRLLKNDPAEHRCPPGTHEIRATRPGYKPLEQQVEVKPGERTEIAMQWEPEPSPVRKPKKKPDGAGKRPPSDAATSASPKTEAPSPKGKTESPSPKTEAPSSKPHAEDSSAGAVVVAPPAPHAEGQAPPAPAKEPAPPPAAASALSRTAGKHPIPSDAERQRVAAQIDDAYQLAQARTAQEKLDRAAAMLRESDKYRDRAPELYGLLARVAELASEGGDAGLMLDAIDVAAEQFAIDACRLKLEMLARFAAGARDAARVKLAVEKGAAAVEDAGDEAQLKSASALADQLYQISLRTYGREQRKQAVAIRNRSKQRWQAWQEYQSARGAIQGQPDDPALNLVVGRWLCLEQNDWPHGLPHLAKGSDAQLQGLARQELQKPVAAEAQIRLADGWWDLAQSSAPAAQRNLLLHAGTWYRPAQQGLTPGLVKTKVDRRLDELAARWPQARPAQRDSARDAAGPGTPAGPGDSAPSGPAGQPMSRAALVTNPAMLRGARSWTIESLHHRGTVTDLAYSPDGSLLATCGADCTVRVWRRRGLELAHVLLGHEQDVRALAWSPDGQLLASGGADAQVRLWALPSGRLVAMLPGQERAVQAMAWSPNGALSAAAGDARVVNVWEVPAGKLVKTFRGHTDGVRCLAWSPGSRQLASGSGDKAIWLWDLSGPDEGRVLGSDEKGVHRLAWSPSGKLLVSATDNTLTLRNPASGETLRVIDAQTSALRSVCWSPDEKTLATRSGDSIQLWDPQSGQRGATLRWEGRGYVWGLAYAPNGRELAAGTEGGCLRIWDPASGEALASNEGTFGHFGAAPSWSPDGRQLAAHPAKQRTLWDLAAGGATCYPVGDVWVRALHWAPRGDAVAMCLERKVKLFEPTLKSVTATAGQHTREIVCLAWAPDGRTIAASDEERVVRIWNVATQEAKQTVKVEGGNADYLAWSPDSLRLAVRGEGSTVRVWEVAREEPLFTLGPAEMPVAWSPNGDRIASKSPGNKLSLWEAKSGRLARQADLPGSPAAIAWTADGKAIAAGAWGASTVDAESGQVLRTAAILHGIRVEGYGAFSPDKQYVAYRHFSGTIRVMETATGKVLRTLALLPQGHWIVLTEEGHCQFSPGAEKELCYLVATDGSPQLLSPVEFAAKYHWRNEPGRTALARASR